MKLLKDKRLLAAALLVVFLGTTAESCESDAAPAPDSDSQQSYNTEARIPVDDEVYEITGTVLAPIDSLVRQTAPAEGGVAGSGFGGFVSVSGWYSGPEMGGKGFVRLEVTNVTPFTDSARSGSVAILKTSDTKALALESGDSVTFKCRRQYEAIAAVRDNETFNADKVATWELDYCRLTSPVLGYRG